MGFSNGVAPHIETMKTLNAQIQKERQTPSDVEGMVEKWSGAKRTAALSELTDAKLGSGNGTRREEIAALLPAYKCPPLDIDAELKNAHTVDPKKDLTPTAFSKKHKKQRSSRP